MVFESTISNTFFEVIKRSRQANSYTALYNIFLYISMHSVMKLNKR